MLKIWSFKPDEIIPFALTAVCQNYVLKCCVLKSFSLLVTSLNTFRWKFIRMDHSVVYNNKFSPRKSRLTFHNFYIKRGNFVTVSNLSVIFYIPVIYNVTNDVRFHLFNLEIKRLQNGQPLFQYIFELFFSSKWQFSRLNKKQRC